MNTSIIIPTYNGASKILNVLRALEQQTYSPDEVIVVVDGSTDNTIEILAKNKFSFKKYKFVEQKNGGRARVRNRGAREATGDLLIFFDDDMRPTRDCVERHVDHHLAHPDSIMTGAQMEEESERNSDFVNFKAYLSRKWYQPYIHQTRIESRDKIFLTAANFSISKKLFTALGGFDERLTDAEDYDLAVRAYLMQVAIFVDINAIAWHDDFVNCARYIRRQKQYLAAHQKLIELKPDLYQHSIPNIPSVSGKLKEILFSFFALPFWVLSIDRNIWLALPRSLRYRLYDIVVTAHGKKS